MSLQQESVMEMFELFDVYPRLAMLHGENDSFTFTIYVPSRLLISSPRKQGRTDLLFLASKSIAHL